MSKCALLTVCVVTLAFGLPLRAADLSDSDKQFLANYEKVRAALAADKLADAKTAATDVGEEGAPIAKSDSLIIARRGFEPLSEHAIKLASGQTGYYVAYCPMMKKDWVQTSPKISNPYGGTSMLSCGSIKK